MSKKEMKGQLETSLWLSSQKVPEKTDPMATNMTAFDGNNKPGESENDEMKETKRKMLFINVAAVLICTGLLINRASICLERCCNFYQIIMLTYEIYLNIMLVFHFIHK